jgi:hypothetical protein
MGNNWADILMNTHEKEKLKNCQQWRDDNYKNNTIKNET